MGQTIMKTFGIAVPTYKREEEIRKLLANIPDDVQVFVSDNGSFLTNTFQTLYPNVVIKRVIPEVPMFRNWNSAASAVQNKWMVIPADDDVYFSKSFSIIEQYLEQYTDLDMIVFGHDTIDASGNVLNSWVPQLETCMAPSGFLKFQYGVDARMPSIFVKTALFKELGGFDEGFRITAADSDFVQRAALIGNVQFVPEVVSGYRVWEGGLTHNKIASVEWMEEIDRWCDRIMAFCKEREIDLYSETIRDEIYIRNLLAGVVSAKKSNGYVAAWKHMMKCRYPHKALLRTQRRLLYRLIRP